MLWSGYATGQKKQLPTPGEGKMNNPPPPGLVVSIDPGIPVLLVGGIVLGVYFLRKRKLTDSAL